jgi:hypothetical protein
MNKNTNMNQQSARDTAYVASCYASFEARIGLGWRLYQKATGASSVHTSTQGAVNCQAAYRQMVRANSR